jgi:hypothetical protein
VVAVIPRFIFYTVSDDFRVSLSTQILKHVQRSQRASLISEFQAYGLRLCLSDMNQANFMKDRNGKIVALDFGATCFLPISFFELALCNSDPFTQLLRPLISRPESTQLNALWLASRSLVQFGKNTIGEHISSLSPCFARRLKSAQVSRTSSGQPRKDCSQAVLASSCVALRCCELARCLGVSFLYLLSLFRTAEPFAHL